LKKNLHQGSYLRKNREEEERQVNKREIGIGGKV